MQNIAGLCQQTFERYFALLPPKPSQEGFDYLK
jgi:hypothetical protein